MKVNEPAGQKRKTEELTKAASTDREKTLRGKNSLGFFLYKLSGSSLKVTVAITRHDRERERGTKHRQLLRQQLQLLLLGERSCGAACQAYLRDSKAALLN